MVCLEIFGFDDMINNPKFILSILYLTVYFCMLAAVFYVEIADDITIKTGEDSMMSELQILMGVLTAGVGQILSYWFSKKDAE